MRSFITLLLVIMYGLINPMNHCIGTVTTNQVYTFETLSNDIIDLKHAYNDEIEIKTIGKSHFGREIWAIKLGKGKTNILISGAHHGREWLTASLLMKMLEQYAYAYHVKQPFGPYSTGVLDNVSIWFVPMVNPDGVTIAQTGMKSAPSNQQRQLFTMNAFSLDFSSWKANGVGVDLNRQYPAGWSQLENDPSVPWYQFYIGQNPIEAEEVRALTSFTEMSKPEVALSYHSSGREIFWKYKNNKQHLIRDRRLAQKVSKLTDYPLSTPEKSAIGAGYTDWFISTYQKPGMTIEISYSVGETSPPLSVFAEEWQRNKLVGIMIATEAAKLIQAKRDK